MANLRDLINGLRANEKAGTEPTTNSLWGAIRNWPKGPNEAKGTLFYLLKTSRDYRAISEAMQWCQITKNDFEDMILQAVVAAAPKDFKHIKGFPPAAEMAAALMEEGHDWKSGDLKELRKIIVSVSNLTASEIPEPYLTAVDKAADDWMES